MTNVLTWNLSTKSKQYIVVFVNDEKVGVVKKSELIFLQRANLAFTQEEEELNTLLLQAAFEIIYNYLARSERTEYDCRKLLQSYFFLPDLIEHVIVKAKEKSYLSDQRYAELFIDYCIMQGKSKMDILHRLKQKKISPTLYIPLMETQYNATIQQDILLQLIRTGIKKYGKGNQKECYEKTATWIVRKGFAYGHFRELLSKEIKEYYQKQEDILEYDHSTNDY